MSAHWHEAPAKPGFIHNDYNICSVIDDGAKDYTLTGNCYYSDDTATMTPQAQKIARSVAMLYYLNNESDHPSDGGTSIYGNYKFHSKMKDIPPKNNSIFVFAVQPNSYHGFTGASFNRSAIVQWFHSSPAYMVSKYKKLMKEKYIQYGSGFERWQPKETMWDIRNDPEYKKYFQNQNLSLEQISKQQKEYKKQNRELIDEKAKEKIECECGSNVRKSDLARHRKSQKHLDYLNNLK